MWCRVFPHRVITHVDCRDRKAVERLLAWCRENLGEWSRDGAGPWTYRNAWREDGRLCMTIHTRDPHHHLLATLAWG